MMKGQTAIEYLTTYGWAILITLLAISILFYLGVINPKGVLPSTCVFPADFTCRGYVLNESGYITLDLGQATGHPINVTKFKCTQETNYVLESSDALAIPVQIPDGRHAIITDGTQVCHDKNGNPVTGRVGDQYKGKLYVEYVELDTGFVHTVVGELSTKYE